MLLLAATLLVGGLGCRAPTSEALQGKAAEAIQAGIERGAGRFDHSLWSHILGRYVRAEGRQFDYASLKKEELPIFETYLGALRKADLASLSKPELKALFINAYNAFTIKTILDTVTPEGGYGVSSIRNIPRVFDRNVHDVGGFPLSLNQIEHNILRPFFRDPRIHFAVNCASLSCPPLRTRAFTGEKVEDELEEATHDILGSHEYVRIEGARLRVTKILDWYGGDFVNPRYTGSERSLRAYLRKYASPDVAKWIDAHPKAPSVEFMDYDWRLNSTRVK